ncbi:Hypothetical predicted protein [Cloeon dipterum]|uniref:Fibronectin type-III domain-containing protein n=1 Tax=Cloeon dipterum TaxID=197152 RepID=A0A8S1DNL2_9INSE|nr:Hypothetical predicted protein [Cloeon dipterum]
MVWEIRTCMMFLLFLLRFHFAFGYLVKVNSETGIKACVTDDHQHAIAFVKHWKSYDAARQPDNITNVEIFGLDGTFNELEKFDCNLVKKGGCEQWRTKNFSKKSNKYGNYPPVTDFRWHDLPVYSGNERTLQLTEEIRKNKSTNSHYSMLTNSDYKVYFGKESVLEASNLAKNIPGDEVNEIRIRSVRDYQNFHHYFYRDYYYYQASKSPKQDLWHILTFNYSADTTKFELIVHEEGKRSSIDIDLIYMDVFTPTILLSRPALVKHHAYNLLVPENSNTWMEREIDINEASSFCVDVVYLLKNKLNSSESPLNVTLTMQNGRTEHFTHNEASKNADATWQVARFENPQRRFKGKVTIRLSVGSKDLEIGGVKFCTGGDLVVIPKDHSKQYDCQILSNQPPKTNGEDIKKVATSWKICERLGKKDCSEMRAGQHCFGGYSGRKCLTPCSGNNYGMDCAEEYPAGRCVNDKYSRKDGSCDIACANGAFRFPLCTTLIRMVDPVVVSVSTTTIKLRMPDRSQLTGHEYIAVQYRKKNASIWLTKVHKETDGEFVTLEQLKPNWDYEITLTVNEYNWDFYLQNVKPGPNITVKTCRPIDGSNVHIQIDDSGAALINAVIDEDYCQLDTLNIFLTTDIEKRREQLQVTFPIVSKTHYNHKLHSCYSGSYYDVTLLDVNKNEVDARLNCTSKDHLAVLSPPTNPLVPTRCKPINASLVDITIEDPFKVFVGTNTRTADSRKLCAPKLMRVSRAASTQILSTKQVDDFGSEKDFGDCVIGSTYDVTLVDQEENEFTVKHACWTVEHRAFRLVFPIIEKVGARKIKLDMWKSLGGIIHYEEILVRFLEKKNDDKKWKSVTYEKSMGRFLTLDSLKPKTYYLIWFVWSSKNHPSIEGKAIEQHTSPCIAIDKNTVEWKFEAPLTVLANSRANASELEELCHWERIIATSGEKTLNTRAYESSLRWDLYPCEPGREFVFRLQDEQGNSVETNATCSLSTAPRHENEIFATNFPSTSPWEHLTPKTALEMFLMFALILTLCYCAYRIVKCSSCCFAP